MSDLRESLDREARRIAADAGALSTTYRRVERQRSRRRVVSGAIALAVATTGVLVAVRSFQSQGGSPRPAQQPATRQPPIWPSFGVGANDAEAIDALQAQVDQGHQPGFLSPEIVGQMFAMEIMEWERGDIETRVSEDGPVRVAISNPSLAGSMGDVRTILTMERWRGRDEGIFVIMRAETDILDLRSPTPGQDIRGAEELTFSGSLQDISQRLLELSLAMSIEGGRAFASYEMFPSEVEIAEGEELPSSPPPGDPLSGELRTGTSVVTPGPDGEFADPVSLPRKVPPFPGVSVFVEHGGGNKVAVEAFRLGDVTLTSDSPVPGPTPTGDDATPAPVEVEVADGTGDLDATSYLGLLLQDRGRGTHHGGYSIVATIDPTTGDFVGMETTEAIDRTVISRVPGAEDEAERLRRLFFPNAAIRGRIPGSGSGAPIEIHLGRDFLVTEEEGLAVHNFVLDFLDNRLAGGRAERYLSPEALRLYESGQGGLSLYGYSSHEVGVRALHEEEDGSWRAVVALSGKSDDTHYESLELTRVSDDDMTQWTITYAERNS